MIVNVTLLLLSMTNTMINNRPTNWHFETPWILDFLQDSQQILNRCAENQFHGIQWVLDFLLSKKKSNFCQERFQKLENESVAYLFGKFWNYLMKERWKIWITNTILNIGLSN